MLEQVLGEVAHSYELVLVEQPLQACLAAGDPDVGPPARQAAQGEPWLIWIEFPRMEVEDACRVRERGKLAQASGHHKRRKKAKVAATGDREVLTQEMPGCRGEFKNLALGAAGEEGRSRRIRDTIPIVANGEDRGIVKEAELGEDIEGPAGAVHDAERRSAESHDARPARLFQGIDAGLHVIPERLGIEMMHAAMIQAMAGDFVTRVDEGSNQLRVGVGNLPHDEEGGEGTLLRELLEQPERGRLHSIRVGALKLGSAGEMGRGFDAVMFLHIEAQRYRKWIRRVQVAAGLAGQSFLRE